MSQYLPPYTPPNVTPYYGAALDPLRPARRASVLMFIMGPVVLLIGGCAAAMPSMLKTVPSDQAKSMMDQLQKSTGLKTDMLFAALQVAGACMLIFGLAMLVLGVFVRRGGRAPAVISLVLVGIIVLQSLVSLLSNLTHAGDPNAIAGVCMGVIWTSIFGLLFAWLLQAARASSRVKLTQQQYQAQYWQYQQNMQAYSAYGHQPPPPGYPQSQGYAQASVPPPPNVPQASIDPNPPPPAEQ